MRKIADIQEMEIIKGYKARFVHSENVTLAFWDVEEGAILPEHSHIHEQITQVLEGNFELTVNGITKNYERGWVAIIPSNILHSGKAVTACKLLDIFTPVREDYKQI